MNQELIGACGLYCGGCKNYDKEQKVCGGCGSQKLTEWCAKCEIRLCVKEKEYTSCIECKDYSCKKHKDFFDGGKLWEGARHRNDIMKNLKYLKESESENWLSYQSERWKCECGKEYTYYDKKCQSCNKPLFSYSNTNYINNSCIKEEILINGKRYLFKGLSNTDGEKLGIYFDELSPESRMRFGPHPLNSQFALLLCQELEYDYFISRFIIENVEDMSIEGYFILDFNLSPHEKNRYKYFKTEENVDGIELKAFKDVLFAPSIADKSQNTGLASAVMPFIINYAKVKNVRNIVLMGGTQETNQRAIRFYEKFNFKRVGGYMTDIYNYDMLLSI